MRARRWLTALAAPAFMAGMTVVAMVPPGPPPRPAPGPPGLLARDPVLPEAAEDDRRGSGKPEKKKGPGKDKPKLVLSADPAVGFTPVTTILTGHLTGVDMRDPNFCHAAVTWVRIDPGQTEDSGFRIREDPACLHAPEEVSVETSFTRTFFLSRPGAYLVRLIVEGRDGTRVHSGFAKIQVLRVQ